jgi:hypothetical protein
MFHLNNIPAKFLFHRQELLMTAVVCNKFKQFFCLFLLLFFLRFSLFFTYPVMLFPVFSLLETKLPPFQFRWTITKYSRLDFHTCNNISSRRRWSGSGTKSDNYDFKAVLRIRDPVPFWPLDPGYVFSGSQIPNLYFWDLSDIFLGKKSYNSLKIGANLFLQHYKT